MIGILGGMGTQAGLDFCNKLTVINRGKTDQKYPDNLPEAPPEKPDIAHKPIITESWIPRSLRCQ